MEVLMNEVNDIGNGLEHIHYPLLCRSCSAEAVAIYQFPHGCFCFADKLQALCEQHIYKTRGFERTFICLAPGVSSAQEG